MSKVEDEDVPDLDSVDEEEEQKAVSKPAEVEEDTTLLNSDVVVKYQETAKIVQAALAYVSTLV